MAKTELELKRVSEDLIVAYAKEFGGALSLDLVEGVLKEYFIELQRKFVRNRIQGMDPVSLELFTKLIRSSLSFEDEDGKSGGVDKKQIKHGRRQ